MLSFILPMQGIRWSVQEPKISTEFGPKIKADVDFKNSSDIFCTAAPKKSNKK